jgi:hypothetical protein
VKAIVMNDKLKLLANIALFQIGWFACLLLSYPWFVMVTVVILLLHFYCIVEPHERKKEMSLIAIVLVVGIVIESIYLFGEVLVRVDGANFPAFWLLFIWVLFATTFRYSMSWLRSRLRLAAVFAGVAAPMSYYTGANLNASVSLNDNVVFSLVVISLSWALAFPMLMRFLVPVLNREA